MLLATLDTQMELVDYLHPRFILCNMLSKCKVDEGCHWIRRPPPDWHNNITSNMACHLKTHLWVDLNYRSSLQASMARTIHTHLA